MTALGVAPALPLHAAGKYVAGAYVVFVALILVYVMIMAIRLSRMERQLVELGRDLAERDASEAKLEAGREPPRAREATAGRHADTARHPDAGREPAAPLSGSTGGPPA